MPHCQICLVEAPNHLDNCPVKTGRSVSPDDNYSEHAHKELMERLGQLPSQVQGIMGHCAPSVHRVMEEVYGHEQAYHTALYQARLELRIERLEKELAILLARVAKLERAEPAPY
jgi:hypothetical protein